MTAERPATQLPTGDEFKELCLDIENTQQTRQRLQGAFPLVLKQVLGPALDPDIRDDYSKREERKIGQKLLLAYRVGHQTEQEYSEKLVRHAIWSQELKDRKARISVSTPRVSNRTINEQVPGTLNGVPTFYQGDFILGASGILTDYVATYPTHLILVDSLRTRLGRTKVQRYDVIITEDVEMEIAWPNDHGPASRD